MTQALQTIERRVNELGVAEPIVARHGAANVLFLQVGFWVGPYINWNER